MTPLTRRLGLGAALLALSATASAHTGHGTHGLMAGLAHPLGLDHLVAMLAVGTWSALALQGARRWQAPLTFLGAMAIGAMVGAASPALPFVETGIAASLLVLGAMLALARQFSPRIGLALVAVAAGLHGIAHGSELPGGADVASYAIGFMLTTAALHLGGLGLGLALARCRTWAWQLCGSMVGGVGLLMLSGL